MLVEGNTAMWQKCTEWRQGEKRRRTVQKRRRPQDGTLEENNTSPEMNKQEQIKEILKTNQTDQSYNKESTWLRHLHITIMEWIKYINEDVIINDNTSMVFRWYFKLVPSQVILGDGTANNQNVQSVLHRTHPHVHSTWSM